MTYCVVEHRLRSQSLLENETFTTDIEKNQHIKATLLRLIFQSNIFSVTGSGQSKAERRSATSNFFQSGAPPPVFFVELSSGAP